jgi:preprotein translocase subunit SecY
MLSTFLNIFKITELRNKILFTLGMLVIYRLGFCIPVPGVDQEAMAALSGGGDGGLGSLVDVFNLFTGGNLTQSTIFGLGIMPYISASIVFQLLVTVLPSLEKLAKEGEAGRRKIQEYTRYATVGLCLIQATVWMKYLAAQGFVFDTYSGSFLGTGLSFSYFLMSLLLLTAGTIFLMWIGEQIDEYGIGSGISLIIMAGIISRMPHAMIQVQQDFSFSGSGTTFDPTKLLLIIIMFISVVAGSILITQAQRRIPIQQAKQTRGRRVYGGQRHYLPLRVNHGGVMPIIFASSMLVFPSLIFGWLAGMFRFPVWRFLSDTFREGAGFIYTTCYVVAVYFFAYFWTTVQFQPKEMANNLRDYGSFIPGLRPGKRTADYLERVMGRITYVGAGFLAIIAVIPTIVAASMRIPFSVSAFLGGTGLLIVVSVTLDVIQRIEANLIMRNYKGFLGEEGPIKGRR